MVMVVLKHANACVEHAIPMQQIKIKVAFVIVVITEYYVVEYWIHVVRTFILSIHHDFFSGNSIWMQPYDTRLYGRSKQWCCCL